jgi:ATP-dependent Clp protease ATP-binding subunit ClpC
VLFDEIEKAHPEVFNMLLQILEDGVLTDAKGRKIDFTNTVIIMTSNVGADKLQKEAAFGFQAHGKQDKKDLDALHAKNKDKVRDELKKLMRPELLNRIDKVVVFRALTQNDALKILDLQIAELSERLVKHGIAINVSLKAKKHLLKEGYDALNGVRPMRRLIQDTIEDTVAEGLLASKYHKGNVIQIDVGNGKLVYDIAKEQ